MSRLNKENIYEDILIDPNNSNLWEILYNKKENNLYNDINFNSLCLIDSFKSYPAWNYRRLILKKIKIDDKDFLIKILKLDIRNYHAWNYLKNLNNEIKEYIALYFFILDESNYSARTFLIKKDYYLSNNNYKELKELNKTKNCFFNDLKKKISLKLEINILSRIHKNNNLIEIYYKELFNKIQLFNNNILIFEWTDLIKKKFMFIKTNLKINKYLKIKINDNLYSFKKINDNIYIFNSPCYY